MERGVVGFAGWMPGLGRSGAVPVNLESHGAARHLFALVSPGPTAVYMSAPEAAYGDCSQRLPHRMPVRRSRNSASITPAVTDARPVGRASTRTSVRAACASRSVWLLASARQCIGIQPGFSHARHAPKPPRDRGVEGRSPTSRSCYPSPNGFWSGKQRAGRSAGPETTEGCGARFTSPRALHITGSRSALSGMYRPGAIGALDQRSDGE
jgi:hypothetical protein